MGAESQLIEMVHSGLWMIDAAGRVWLSVKRQGNKEGGTRLHVLESPARVEHRLPNGYLQVRAAMDGGRVHGLAHRLVWHWLNGPIPEGHQINHINGQKDDNQPGNLEVVTPSENALHAHATGLCVQTGEANGNSALTESTVRLIRQSHDAGESQASIAERFGVAFQTVSKIVRRERWTHVT